MCPAEAGTGALLSWNHHAGAVPTVCSRHQCMNLSCQGVFIYLCTCGFIDGPQTNFKGVSPPPTVSECLDVVILSQWKQYGFVLYIYIMHSWTLGMIFFFFSLTKPFYLQSPSLFSVVSLSSFCRMSVTRCDTVLPRSSTAACAASVCLWNTWQCSPCAPRTPLRRGGLTLASVWWKTSTFAESTSNSTLPSVVKQQNKLCQFEHLYLF